MEIMMKRNEKKLVSLIKEEYQKRLLSLFRENVKDIFEADMFDKEGNQLLSQGLKVKHKGSGYEYTVDHVEGKGNDAVVYLRHPEMPRFKTPVSQAPLTEGEDEGPRVKVDQVDLSKVMGSESDEALSMTTAQDPMDAMKQMSKGSLLKITRKEFEKEYEVK